MKQPGVNLTFACDMDENTAWEIEQKGWFELADAHLPDGTVVRVNFYDPVRLAQILETELKIGKTCFAEPAMIVVPSVSIENMKAAVEDLYQSGYFEELKTLFRHDNHDNIDAD